MKKKIKANSNNDQLKIFYFTVDTCRAVLCGMNIEFSTMKSQQKSEQKNGNEQ